MRRLPLLLAALLLGPAAAGAQTATPTPGATPTPTPGPPTTLPTGTSYATENTAHVNGVRIRVQPDGSVWFLEAGADRVGVLRGTTITYWQLRPTNSIGANPVDFKIDGATVWILESGESEIPAGNSALGALDTVTGNLTEWVIPGSIPAAFHRTADGKVYIPETNGALQRIDLNTLEVINYRSTLTFAYADMVLGPDGAFWLADFGNNRIVRWEPDSDSEDSWTFFNPASGQLDPAQIQFDDQGQLWLAQLLGNRMDRFDPATGTLTVYDTVNRPIHFDIYQNRLYVTSAQTPSAITVLDPNISLPFSVVLTKVTGTVGSSAGTPLTIRNTTITPTTFSATGTALASTDLTLTVPGIGALTTNLPSTSTNTYGITVAGGSVWLGTDGALVNLDLQTIGGTADMTVPVATTLGGPADSKIRIDLTLSNLGTAPISGDALYLYSPGSFAPRTPFTVPAGATTVLTDAFNVTTNSQLGTGPIRIRVSSGTAADLAASARSARVFPNSGSIGYSLPAQPAAERLGPGDVKTLFLGTRDIETSVLGLFAADATTGTLTLLAPDGTTRGTYAFSLIKDIAEEYNPAASAFGVAPEPGDVVRVSVTTGSVQVYGNVIDLDSRDVAISLPVGTTRDAVIPNAGEAAGASGTSFVSDLLLSNTDTAATAAVSIAFYPLGGVGPPGVADLSLAPLESRVIADFLPTLFGTTGQGSLILTSSTSIASLVRIAARTPGGDLSAYAAPIDESAGIPGGGSAIFVGVPQTATRHTNLVLFNRGVDGDVQITGVKADGSSTGSVSLPVLNHAAARLDSVFSALGVANQAGGRIRVAPASGMSIFAWTGEVDGITADVEIAPPQLVTQPP